MVLKDRRVIFVGVNVAEKIKFMPKHSGVASVNHADAINKKSLEVDNKRMAIARWDQKVGRIIHGHLC
jgi:hypothetical protein